jgi:hypothetical protein
MAPTTTTMAPTTTTMAPATTTVAPTTTTTAPVPTQGASVSGNAHTSGSGIVVPSFITFFCATFLFLLGTQL